jgi:hypothetical protein
MGNVLVGGIYVVQATKGDQTESADEITAAFRDVKVHETPPVWWNASIDACARRLSLTTADRDKALALLARETKRDQ